MSVALNPKQLRFVELYLATGNATEAYVGAGYSARGHSAESCATKLLKNAEVQAAVGKARDRAAETAELTAGYVIRGLMREAEREDDNASHPARVKALEHLARITKLLGDERPVPPPQPEGLTLESFARILAALATPTPAAGGAGGGAGGADDPLV